MYAIDLYVMAGLYGLAGITHFISPRVYLAIMPPWVPAPVLMNLLVGVAEVAAAIGLVFSETRMWAAYGVILLLIAVFPANWYHHQKARKKGKMVTVTLIRLPMQLALMYWAWLYT